MVTKGFYLVLAILFTGIVIIDFLIFYRLIVDGTPIHPQLKQHFYTNPPIMIFLWYMVFKKN